MAEERDFHFPHDHNASEDPKLVAVFRKFGDSGIGFYWRLIERLANRRKISLGDIPDVAFAMHTEESKFQEYLDFFTEKALLCQDSEHFWSNGLNNRLKALDRVRELNANAGRISGEKRREKSNNRLTSAQHLLNTNPTSVEQRDREIERERGSGGVFVSEGSGLGEGSGVATGKFIPSPGAQTRKLTDAVKSLSQKPNETLPQNGINTTQESVTQNGDEKPSQNKPKTRPKKGQENDAEIDEFNTYLDR